MAESARAKKLKIQSGQRIAILQASRGYQKELQPLPANVELSPSLNGTFDWIQVFVRSKKELDSLAPKVIRALKPESMLWVSFPKGSSGIQTDLSRDKGWDVPRKEHLRWITLVSVNDTWSAFNLRPLRPGEAKR